MDHTDTCSIVIWVLDLESQEQYLYTVFIAYLQHCVDFRYDVMRYSDLVLGQL